MKKSILFVLISIISLKINSQSHGYLWAKNIGARSAAKSCCTDLNGNVFETGFYSGTVTFGSTTFTSTGYQDVFLVKYDPSGNILWAKKAAGIGSPENYATGVATDASGNVYITGRFGSATLNFGSTVLYNIEGTGSSYSDIFIAKYSSTGNFLWAKSAGGTSGAGAPYDDIASGIAIDKIGNVIITGFFRSPTLTFGLYTLTNNGNSGSADIFIAKYNSSGNPLWAKNYGETSNDLSWGIATDLNNNVLITGAFASDSINFSPSTIVNTGFNYDVFLAKLDASGNEIWAKSAGGNIDGHGRGITTDLSGNILITGGFYGTSIIFGTDTLINKGLDDIFLVKYDTFGNVIWAKSEGGTDPEISYSVATDSMENIALTGMFSSSTLVFGTDTLIKTINSDIFIVKYDSSGNELWANSMGGTANFSGNSQDYGNSVSFDPNGDIFIAGCFDGNTITFGSVFLTNGNNGYDDSFLVKLGLNTGIEYYPQEDDAYLRVYPNPNNGVFSIELMYPYSFKPFYVSILNALGENVYSQKRNSTNSITQLLEINLSSLSKGIYFVQLIFDNNKVLNKKISKIID